MSEAQVERWSADGIDDGTSLLGQASAAALRDERSGVPVAAAGGITRALSAYVVDSRFEDIPDVIRQEGVRSIMAWFGCAIGGCRHEAVEIALATVLDLSAGARRSSSVGGSGQTP